MSFTKIILSFIGFITFAVVSYVSYFYYAKNQGDLIKLKSEHELLKKEKDGLENSKADLLVQSKNTENKIKELERENNKIKQDVAILEKKLAGSISYKECEDKTDSKLKASMGISEENCNAKVEAALIKKETEVGKQIKNLISQENCNQKIDSSIKKTKVDLEKDHQIKIRDFKLEMYEKFNAGSNAAAIMNDIKHFVDNILKDTNVKNEQKIMKPSNYTDTTKSCEFNSVHSSPHLFIDMKAIKFKKKACLKIAESKMNENNFKELEVQTNGVWGIKNGYKGYILCANEGKIAIFSVVGEHGNTAKNYAKQLKKDF